MGNTLRGCGLLFAASISLSQSIGQAGSHPRVPDRPHAIWLVADPVSGAFVAPPVGASFEWSDGSRFTVTEVDGLAVSGKNGREQPLFLYGRIVASPHLRFDRAKVDAFWPLQVGKSVSVETSGTTLDGRSGTWTNDARVLRIEKITVPAGTFDTFVVEIIQTGTSGGGQGYKGKLISWYVPTLGANAKYEFETLQGRYQGQKSSAELVKVTKP